MELLNKLQENPKNPRKIGKEEFNRLKESIKNFPQMLEKRPIVYDENYIVLGGNQRFRALKDLDKEGFEVKEEYFKSAEGWSEDQKREFSIKDNISDGEWDFEAIKSDWADLPLDSWGLSKENWEDKKEVEEVETPDIDKDNVVSKYGEVYQLGKHKLMCGDSTKEEDLNKSLQGNKIDMVFTSPPYNMGAKMYENYKDDLKSEEYIEFNMKVVSNIIPHLKGYLFWNISYNKKSRWEFLEIMYRLVKETGLRFLEMIVWDKGHGLPITSKDMLTRQYEDILLLGNEENVSRDLELFYMGTKYKRAYMNKKTNKGITNYWRVDTNNTQLVNHLACFPVKLPAKGIELVSAQGDIVLDVFGGSGSTLLACEQLNRVCYTMELDPKYCDVIRKRYANFINKGENWIEETPVII